MNEKTQKKLLKQTIKLASESLYDCNYFQLTSNRVAATNNWFFAISAFMTSLSTFGWLKYAQQSGWFATIIFAIQLTLFFRSKILPSEELAGRMKSLSIRAHQNSYELEKLYKKIHRRQISKEDVLVEMDHFDSIRNEIQHEAHKAGFKPYPKLSIKASEQTIIAIQSLDREIFFDAYSEYYD